jgi:hypothetical protein
MNETSRKPRRLRRRALVLVAVVVTLAVTAGAQTACGGKNASGETGSSTPSTPATTASASPTAAPTTTAQIAAAWCAGGAAGQSTAGLFAKDGLAQDRAFGELAVGVKAIEERQMHWYAVLGTFEPLSRLVGSHGFVAEVFVAGSQYGVDVVRVRGGKIITDYLYYDDLQQHLLTGTNAPKAVKAPPAASDTAAASRAVAGHYMSALRALAPARLASMYAGTVVYQDTGRDRVYRGPAAAAAAHAKMFALKGVSFQPNGVLAGPGWAAVMWKRTDREGGKPLVDIPVKWTKLGKGPTIHGVSILEIRDGKIARETIYCDHVRTMY